MMMLRPSRITIRGYNVRMRTFEPERAPTLPILAVSGFRFRDTMDPGLEFLGMSASAGATVCLRQPFSPRQLMAAVHASRDPTLLDDRLVGNREARQGPLG
jgi:hypothetical protein